jgi:cytochrome b561
MQLRNSASRYGWVSIFLHWGVALAVFGLFALGLWMVGLDYYSSWRKDAPDLHKSIGLVLLGVMVLRVLWRLSAHRRRRCQLQPHDALGAKLGHGFLYVGLFAVMIAGYLISTADGVGIPVFGLFEVPALVSGLPDQADTAGVIHLWLAWALVFFPASMRWQH